MSISVVYPERAHTAYKIAAEEFVSLAKEVSTQTLTLVSDHEELPSDTSSVVVIGADSVNSVCANLYLKRKIGDFGIRYNTEDYRVYTKNIDGLDYLFIAGGRPRATLYAIYRYFEKFCGCRWFWDGDRITKVKELPLTNIDLTESPRFEYRGLRYFAHRSLHRFQAEHWSLEDWQKEIDWMLKKRLNMFMLRIGLDDIFQKAFPDVVDYPKLNEPLPEAGIEHHDRNLFWSLEYRGELRKKLLAYAFERDLMHPEDCGTVTHWYSRTPKSFLEKVNPKLLHSTKYNGELTGQTWDVFDDNNLENYFKLTETHIKEYGKAELFHTIGLAERNFSEDREENMRLKMYVYRRIASFLKEKHPQSKLFIASWDLWMFYTPEEIQRLLGELDPSQSIILDYTSDTVSSRNFKSWDIVGNYPWVFGMFGGYEPDNEFRGFYELTNERIKIAKEDPMCKGVILWPELSHGDTLMTEYLARNAWEKETLSVEETVDNYCFDRYPEEMRGKMREIWRDFMPIVQMRSWSPTDSVTMFWGQNTFTWMIERASFEDKPYPYYGRSPEDARTCQKEAVRVLKALSEIETDDEMLRRDVFDIARTVMARYIDCGIRLAELQYFSKDAKMTETMDKTVDLMTSLSNLLSGHKDFSLFDSLEKMRAVTETKRDFEITLKHNAEGYYCRSFIAENAKYLYLPEMNIIFDEVKRAFNSGKEIDREKINSEFNKNRERYFNTPLRDMAFNCADLKEVLKRAAETIDEIKFN